MKNVRIAEVSYNAELEVVPLGPVWSRARDEKRKTKSRVYIDGEPSPAMPAPPVGIKGENAENDAAWVAYNREELRLMRESVVAGLSAHGYSYKALKFSRYAGCGMCPCSPGFIVEGLVGPGEAPVPVSDIWVKLSPVVESMDSASL